MTTAPVADRGTARKAATRSAIADALLDLLGEGHLRPTAKEIAQRAGISVRSVYVHFEDLEDLFCVAARRQYGRVAPLLEPVPVTGSLRTRAGALIRRRAEIYARNGMVARATQVQAPFSPTLARLTRDAHAQSCRDLERVFAPELEARTPADRARVVAMLDILTGFQSWDTLRETHGLAAAAAERTMIDAVVATVEAAA